MFNLKLNEEQRQLVLMALAHLAVERPGWDETLRELSSMIDNPEYALYGRFKELHVDSIKARREL